MITNSSQRQILEMLKTRGPQSVRILAQTLKMTTMGARQHLQDLQKRELVTTTPAARQQRGRPIQRWKLTPLGHARFPDSHAQITVELIQVIRSTLGEPVLNNLIDQRNALTGSHYRRELGECGSDLEEKVRSLADIRSREGYMAEVRLIPGGAWLLIENHCPICAAAKSCQQFCRSELDLFRNLFENQAHVERTDHLLSGARRCAYKITPTGSTA